MAHRRESGDKKHFNELVQQFDTAMLVTRTRDRGDLHARPMAVAETDANGDIWFVTSIDSAKIAEMAEDPHCVVTMQSTMAFVSMNGQGRIVRDRAKIQSLWRESWRVWFPKGPEETDLVLLRIEAMTGEYWDNQGTKGLRFLFDAAKHYLAGTKKDARNDDQPDLHGKVDLHGR